MPSASVLTRITNLEIVDCPYGAEWDLMPGLHLSTNKGHLDSLLSDPFVMAMGLANAQDFRDSSHFVYARFDDDQISTWFPEAQSDPTRFTMTMDLILLWLRNFLRASWLIKDNCCSCEGAFVIFPDQEVPEISTSLTMHEQNLTCEGWKRSACSISVEELHGMIRLHDLVESTLYTCRNRHGDALQGKRARIVRCFEFIHAARTSYSIPIRLVHYCSALESLFGTGSAELTHKLSERVAAIVGKSQEIRLQKYQLMKRAYGLRSKIVHGGTFSKENVAEVHDVLKDIDDVLRKILLQAFSDSHLLDLLSARGEDIDEYFLQFTMSGGG